RPPHGSDGASDCTSVGGGRNPGQNHRSSTYPGGAPVTTTRPLFLHEQIDIVGQSQWDYMEHTKKQAGHEKVDFELLGTWYVMGITGRWPQVVNIWEIPGGWD